jgi:hypothetical protein
MPNHLRSRDVWGFPHVRDHGLLARALSIVQFCAATPGGARRWVTVDARIFRRRSRYHDSFGSVCWCTDRRLTGAGGVFALLSNTMLPRQVARRSRNETSWSMPPSWGPRSFAQGCNDRRHRPPTRHRRWRHPDQLCQNQSGLAPDRWRCPGGLGALVPALASGCDLHARPAAGCSSPPQHRQALGETEGVPIDPAAQRERALALANATGAHRWPIRSCGLLTGQRRQMTGSFCRVPVTKGWHGRAPGCTDGPAAMLATFGNPTAPELRRMWASKD